MSRLQFTPDQIDARIEKDKDMIDLANNDPTEFEVQHAKMYKAFGYKPDGTPLSAAMHGMNELSRKTGIPEGVVKGIANIPIPMATTFAGALGGSYAPGPGTVAGAVMGSVAGEEINYHLGLRDEPTTVDRSIAALAPVAGPLVSRMKGPFSSVMQGLPGAGKHMHNIAHETVKNQLKKMEVSEGEVTFMRQMFENAPDFKTSVPMLRAAVKRELDSESISLKPDNAYIKQLNALTKELSTNKNVSFKRLMATEKSFIKEGDSAPNEIWTKLSGTLVEDLEAQAANPKLTQQTRDKILQGVESFKNYAAVNKRYRGQKMLDGLLEKSHTRLDDGLIRFNKKTFLKEIEADNNFTKVFEPTEIADMKKAVNDLGYIGPAPQGMMSGAIHTGSLGAAGLAAYSMGGVQGVVAATAALGLIRWGIGTEGGRRVITYLAKKGHGTIQAVELKAMMGKVIAGMNAGAVAGVTGVGSEQSGVNPFPNQE